MNKLGIGVLTASILILGGIGTAQEAYAGSVNSNNGPVGAVGVDYIQPDTTELLLAGMQTNLAWIIPVSLSAVGIGAVLIRKKF